ncbi:peptidoglycan-associated lipoprotein Pal [Altererythrobacter sp. KTW20L]|uniref:peptidoglycan-associated lipoprotein Pal n=1 Tax=Altererythrobacter sp. KTW20L TaxID=2942210 RepID=UPI0020C0CDE3|nr:peptidoglycan-associated lipoprotein Pal [Altererythrobacter sp. KTW20L]MCL6250540.1 peptidoglycan-associated lipoprotein Pal [Altererythrobacter sp. KTW20L]
MKKSALIGVAIGVLALAACSKKPPAELPPVQQTGAPSTSTPTPTPAQSTAPAPGSQAHFAAAMSGRDVIYFDTDMYNIDSEDAAALRAQAEYLLQHTSARATVEGHADERGTREYNLALGERRANAAKNYLVSLGVPDARVRVVSYGEERPAATGSNAEAWARNRRAVTVMIQ